MYINIYMYIYVYTYTHTQTHIYVPCRTCATHSFMKAYIYYIAEPVHVFFVTFSASRSC